LETSYNLKGRESITKRNPFHPNPGTILAPSRA